MVFDRSGRLFAIPLAMPVMEIAVLGAGSMGHGIAHVSAQAGNDVILRDLEDGLVEQGLEAIKDNLEKGIKKGVVDESEREKTLGNIATTTDLEFAVENADLVIEAAPENMDLKKNIFSEVEEAASGETVIATNTSSLSITQISSALNKPERAIGLHFFNPPHIMDLVEVITAEQTNERTEELAVSFVENLEKEDIVVRDTAGFATSRLGLVLGLEAIRMAEQGVASPADIDRGMIVGYGYPMGPIELTDHVGLDVRLHIAEHLYEELGERFRPPQSLRRKVRAGKLGKKSGEGYYEWENGERIGKGEI